MATLTGTDKYLDGLIGNPMDYIFYRYPWSEDLPNHLMWLRLALAPVQAMLLIAGLQNRDPLLVFIALLVLAFQAFTDLVDGYLARKHECTSDSGARWDPLADKLMVLPPMILLISWSKPSFVDNYFAWYLTLFLYGVIIVQEVLSTLWYIWFPGGKSNLCGKLKLWCQVAATALGMMVAMVVINGDARWVIAAMSNFMVGAILFATLSLRTKYATR